MRSELLDVLLIEDNPGDADLIVESLAECDARIRVTVALDGERALELLLRTAAQDGKGLPRMILLDLNLPKEDGRAVLATLKRHQRLRRIPVVVLTSSDAEDDVLHCYELGASCYVTKSVGLREFQTSLRLLAGFWGTVVKLP